MLPSSICSCSGCYSTLQLAPGIIGNLLCIRIFLPDRENEILQLGLNNSWLSDGRIISNHLFQGLSPFLSIGPTFSKCFKAKSFCYYIRKLCKKIRGTDHQYPHNSIPRNRINFILTLLRPAFPVFWRVSLDLIFRMLLFLYFLF